MLQSKIVELPVLVSMLFASAFTAVSAGLLESELQAILTNWSSFSKSSFSLGVALPGTTLSLSAGHYINGDASSGNITPGDRFAMGSATKMYTAAAVLRLIEAGKVTSLEAKALPLMDKFWRRINGSSLVSLVGPYMENVTLRHLLQMRSGIADFDTFEARDYQLSHPLEDIDPVKSLSFLPNRGMSFYCKPGECGIYSSTNYVLLGLVLAQAAGAKSWDEYMQTADLPAEVLREMTQTVFAHHGPCSKYTKVHGYSGQMHRDVYNVSCTGGWTCGNMLSNAADLAYFVRALLGKESRVVSRGIQHEMVNFSTLTEGWSTGLKYGLGIMDMARWIKQPNASFVGHGGDTYGFCGLNGYNKEHDVAISLVTNTENSVLVSAVMSQVYQAVVGNGTSALEQVIV